MRPPASPMQPAPGEGQPPAKAIPPARERLQSRLLVWIVTPPLCVGLAWEGPLLWQGAYRDSLFKALAVSLAFALLARATRAATGAASIAGGLICFQLCGATYGRTPFLLHSGLAPLALLFVLTTAATRFRRAHKEASGTAEAGNGRRTSQVAANLGVAALCGAFSQSHFEHAVIGYGGAIAALAEATADTLSSEIGQGTSGPTFLITNLRRVPAGADGAISLSGTFAGTLGAAVVVLAGLPRPFWSMTPLVFAAIFLAAVAGLFFDSLLGATLERRGWIGNDVVNLLSTAFAALVSWPLLVFAFSLLRL